MASTNSLIAEGIEKGVLLVFAGEVGGVSRYTGFDDVWDPAGDCAIKLDEKEVYFDSRIVFESKSKELISLVSECVCGKGKHYRLNLSLSDESLSEIGKYNLAVRNLIAVMMRKPIVGNSLVSALVDLQAMSTHIFAWKEEPEKAIDFVRNYVLDMKLDNYANRSADIGEFLAWTEKIQWARVFVETFTHCVGMLNCGLLDHASLDVISPTTRALLEQSCSQMHYDVATVEVPLMTFGVDTEVLDEYGDHPGIRTSILAFQNFLKQYYSQIYGEWPPPMHKGSGHWLTRPVAQYLQKDFGNLYDLLVDTKVHAELLDEDLRVPYPWESQYGLSSPNLLDTFGSTFPRHEFIASWNYRHLCHDLPHQNPKSPAYLPTTHEQKGEVDNGIHRTSLVPALHKRCKVGPNLHQIYSQATNEDAYVSHFCKAFMDHEATTKHEDLDTHDGRLGRWIVIYCMMQLLSKVAVDIQGLRYRPGVEYFLHANLDGTPPWRPNDFPGTMRPATSRYSWAALSAKSTDQLDMTARSNVSREADAAAGAVYNADSLSRARRMAKKRRFEVVQLPDGRHMLVDPDDGNIVFK